MLVCVYLCVRVYSLISVVYFYQKRKSLEKAHLQDNTLDLLLHFHSPDIWVGDHLFVKEQTADKTCCEEMKGEVEEGGVGADSVDEPGDVAFEGGGVQGSDMGDVREWCGRDIFRHTLSSLPLIGVPPRWE